MLKWAVKTIKPALSAVVLTNVSSSELLLGRLLKLLAKLSFDHNVLRFPNFTVLLTLDYTRFKK